MSLTLTDTFDFAPSVGEVVLNSLSRIGIRGPMVQTAMLQMASQEANLMQVEWSNRGPNLWTVDEQTTQTIPGYATYAVDPSTIAVLEVTLGQGNPPDETEILLTSISRTEYMAYPNKRSQGRPTVYWYDILIAPTITLWPVPDQVYNLHFTRYRQQMDATLRNAAISKRPIAGSTPPALAWPPALLSTMRRCWRTSAPPRRSGPTASPPAATRRTRRSTCRQ